MSVALSESRSTVSVERWPTERPLFVLSVAVSLVLWAVLAITIVGLIYGALLAAFFFVMQLGFVAYVRGSAVRLGPDQFPELYEAVERISRQIGLERVPEAYLMQAGGALNALATRFLRSHMIILFSDLLEACGESRAARDMIVAHELGHIRAGHLRWHWFLLPSAFVPFLGTALSRAREYTCDRYGLVGAGEREGAVLGLTILAAGGRHAPQVNLQAFVRQRAQLNTGWMRLGEWFSTHPPLARRIAALDPALAPLGADSTVGTLRAAAILGAFVLPLAALSIWGAAKIPGWLEGVSSAAEVPDAGFVAPDAEAAAAQVRLDFAGLAAFLEEERARVGAYPSDLDALYTAWEQAHPGEALPLDPFDGDVYGYDADGASYRLWSSGPDGRPGTTDDLEFSPGSGEPQPVGS